MRYNKALQVAKLFLWLVFFLSIASCKKEKKAAITWTKISSGIADDLKSLCYFDNSDTLYVCGGKRESNGIILRSADQGNTWKTVLQSNTFSFNALYFKNSKEGFALGDFVEIFKTNDGGENWVRCQFTDTVSYNYKVVMRDIKFTNDSVAFAVGGDDFGNGIIIKTADHGLHWRKVLTEDHELRGLHFMNADVAYACGYGILLKTTDGGTSWEATSLSGEFFTGICFTDISNGYLSGYNGNLYKSADGGENWDKTLKGNSLFAVSRNHFTCIDFADSETGIAVGEEGYSLLTQDAGNTWKIASLEEKTSIQQVKFNSTHSGWAVGDDGAIFSFEIQ